MNIEGWVKLDLASKVTWSSGGEGGVGGAVWMVACPEIGGSDLESSRRSWAASVSSFVCIRSDADVIGMGTVGRAGSSCLLLLLLVMIGGSRGGDGEEVDVDEEGGENEEGGWGLMVARISGGRGVVEKGFGVVVNDCELVENGFEFDVNGFEFVVNGLGVAEYDDGVDEYDDGVDGYDVWVGVNDAWAGVNDVEVDENVEVGVNGSSLICLIDSCNGAEGGIGCPKCLWPEKKKVDKKLKKLKKLKKNVSIWSKNVSRLRVLRLEKTLCFELWRIWSIWIV